AFGDDDVVEPDLADVSRRRLRDVDVRPDEVHLEILGGAPAETFKRRAAVRHFEALRAAAFTVPANSFASFARIELVVDPLSFGKARAKVAGQFTVDPEGLFAVGLADVVELDHHLHADPA